MKNKKLYKIKSEKKVSGVCAGIAEFLEIDVTIVRVLAAFLILAWGTGIVLYFILAIILPDKTEIEDDLIKEAEYKEKDENNDKDDKNGSIFD